MNQMSALSFLLFSVVLGDVQTKTINNYVVKIDGNTLKSVEPTGTSSDVLNLSGLGLQVIEKDVFSNLATVKNLNLGNNSLSSIPRGLFSKLVNLEHLSLADNKITKFEKSFEGLDHLKTLDISNNPLTKFEGAEFSGLPKSSVVFTKGLSIGSINAHAFEKVPGNPYYHGSYDNEDEEGDESEDNDEEDEEDDKDAEDDQKPTNVAQKEKPESPKKPEIQRFNKIKICIHDNVLKMVAPLKPNETLPSGCQSATLTQYDSYLSLKNLGIAKFEKGWYQFDKTASIFRIDLSENKIVQLTEELLNDLPSTVRFIDLSSNKIERLTRGIMKHDRMGVLMFDSNGITEIEEGAFENLPALWDLYLSNNLLTDTQFVATLSNTMIKIALQKNRITEITPGSFSGLRQLRHLNLDENLIQEVKSDSFDGCFHLMEMVLSNNRITKIEPGSFQRMNLHELDISNNSIAVFVKDVFDHRPRITNLDVSRNKLSNIKENFPDGLWSDLRSLKLDFNQIQKLERGTFKDLPNLCYLSLGGNKISEIEAESFDLPRLSFRLQLNKNLLNELDVESFRGLESLEQLSLADNRITSVPKGFTKYMTRLTQLDLSNNSIKRLQSGALCGLRRKSYSTVYLKNVPVEVIETGLFDEM